MNVVMLFLNIFFKTRLGLSIRATGDNATMVKTSSINPAYTISVGLALANSLTALSGAIIGQIQKSCDINAGTGIVVIGLASLIIGESIINGRKTIRRNIIGALIGNIIYRLIYAIILQTRLFPIDFLKLATAIILALAIGLPALKDRYNLSKRRHEEA